LIGLIILPVKNSYSFFDLLANTPTLGSPSQALLTQMSHQERPAKRLSKDKRISFDFKTTDANDDGNTKSPLETKGDLPKPRAKGSNNEITETGEENASFVFAGKTYVERNEERVRRKIIC